MKSFRFGFLVSIILFSSCGHSPDKPERPSIPDVVVTPVPVPTPVGQDLPPAPRPDPVLVPSRVYKTVKIGELPFIAEKSGVCLAGDGRIYIIQDSDQSPKVTVATLDGSVLGQIEMADVSQDDFEDVACHNSTVTVGDIGDNDSEREYLNLYTFEAPVNPKAKVIAVHNKVKFDDGHAHNAEGLFYTPDGKLFITTKSGDKKQGLYEIRGSVAHFVSTLSGLSEIGGASSSLSGDGFTVILDEDYRFADCDFSGKCKVSSLIDSSGDKVSGDHEAIAYTSDHSFIFLSEDENEIYETSWASGPVPTPTPAPIPAPLPPPAPVPTPVSDWFRPIPMMNFQIMSADDGDYLKQLKAGTQIVEIECVPDESEGENAGYARLKDIISKFHDKGVKVICYHSLSWEHWRADIHRFPVAAKGAKMSGWDEIWPDWRPSSPAHSFWDQRYDNFASIGADCVEDDNMVDSDDNESGFSLTHADSAASAARRVSKAHAVHLCHFSKNNPSMAKAYSEVSDAIMIESAGQYDEREKYNSWRDKNKFGGMIEYREKDCKPYSGFKVQGHFAKLTKTASYFNGVSFKNCQ